MGAEQALQRIGFRLRSTNQNPRKGLKVTPKQLLELTAYQSVRLHVASLLVLFQNSAEHGSVSLQGFVWPQTRHSRSTWRVLEPV